MKMGDNDISAKDVINTYSLRDLKDIIQNQVTQNNIVFREIFEDDIENSNMLRFKNRFFDKYIYENKSNKIESYEIIRLSRKPTKLADFSAGVRYIIDEKIYFNTTTVSTEIRPNKKYYYICRTSFVSNGDTNS